MSVSSGSHVIVGAGPVGSALARRLTSEGRTVWVVTRSGRGVGVGGVESVAVDASNADALTAVVEGAEVLYNCANPGAYPLWEQRWPPLAAAILTAAERTGAVLVTASNLYGYGPVAEPMTRDTPLRPSDHKGALRVRMWQDALAAHETGQRPLSIGDALLVAAGVPCGTEPEGRATVTTVYLDSDYAVDQFYWQHMGLLLDRFEAADVAATVFAEPTQFLRLGECRMAELGPWLDELVELSGMGSVVESFARMQVLWFLIADAIHPLIKVPSVQEVLARRIRARSESLRHRRLAAPVRVEALAVRDALHRNIGRRWLLRDLAEMVHLESTRG